jgi:hypothetical protein
MVSNTTKCKAFAIALVAALVWAVLAVASTRVGNDEDYTDFTPLHYGAPR